MTFFVLKGRRFPGLSGLAISLIHLAVLFITHHFEYGHACAAQHGADLWPVINGERDALQSDPVEELALHGVVRAMVAGGAHEQLGVRYVVLREPRGGTL